MEIRRVTDEARTRHYDMKTRATADRLNRIVIGVTLVAFTLFTLFSLKMMMVLSAPSYPT